MSNVNSGKLIYASLLKPILSLAILHYGLYDDAAGSAFLRSDLHLHKTRFPHRGTLVTIVGVLL